MAIHPQSICPFIHRSLDRDVVCPKRVAVSDVIGSRWADTFGCGFILYPHPTPVHDPVLTDCRDPRQPAN